MRLALIIIHLIDITEGVEADAMKKEEARRTLEKAVIRNRNGVDVQKIITQIQPVIEWIAENTI